MAKSLRSKWKRKMKAVKRERYGKKELDRLKKVLGIDSNSTDVNMEEISNIATVLPSVQAQPIVASESMDVDGAKKYNPRTLRDEHGNFPVWMSSSRKKKILKRLKKKTKHVKKKQASKKNK